MSRHLKWKLADFATFLAIYAVSSGWILSTELSTEWKMALFGGVMYLYGSIFQVAWDRKCREVKNDEASYSNQKRP